MEGSEIMLTFAQTDAGHEYWYASAGVDGHVDWDASADSPAGALLLLAKVVYDELRSRTQE